MATFDLNNGLVLFAAATSIVCMIVALFAVFIGQAEERILGSMIAAFVVLQTAEVALPNLNVSKIQTAEIVSYAVELGISVWIALRTKRFWPLIVAALFLVKACAALIQFVGMEIGVFALEEVQITLRLIVALIVFWATVFGKSLREHSSVKIPRPF